MGEALMEELRAMAARSFFQNGGMLAHQLDSYDRFCDSGVKSLLESYIYQFKRDITLHDKRDGIVEIRLGNVSVKMPVSDNDRPLLPIEARLRNMSYTAAVHADIDLKLYACEVAEQGETTTSLVKEQLFEKVHIADLPVMVRSKLCHLHKNTGPKFRDCPFDSGGYFIIEGAEKILIPQEQICIQAVCVTLRKHYRVSYGTPSQTGVPNRSNIEYNKGVFTLYMPRADPIPVVMMLRALGICTDKDILAVTTHDVNDNELTELIRPSILEAETEILQFAKLRKLATVDLPQKQQLALDYVGSKIVKRKPNMDNPAAARETIDTCLFPGLATDRRKCLFLGYMIRCLCLCTLGRRQLEDIDSFKFKRVDLPGDILLKKIIQLRNRFGKEIVKRLQKHFEAGKENIEENVIFDKSVIVNTLLSAFSSGRWEKDKPSGSVAILRRDNPMLTLSQQRLVVKTMMFSGNAGDAKLPNASHYGRICPVETPDDEKCGLTKSLALFAIVSVATSEEYMLEKLYECNMQDMEEILLADLNKWDKVFLNGKWLGVTDNPDVFIETLRRLRRQGEIHQQTELARISSQKEIRIFTDAGRILRPLLIVSNHQPLLFTKVHNEELNRVSPETRFSYLIKQGVMELLGPEEEENMAIAYSCRELQSFNYTHLELHPASLMGVGSCFIPFLNHNQASRVTHQSQKHGKQAVGFYTCNLYARMDTNAHHLFYPQRPLLQTRTASFLDKSDPFGRAELTNGANCVVAVSSYSGYNQEDSLILNQSSLDRGLFRSTHYRVHKCTLPAKSDKEYGKPDNELARKNNMGVDHLDSDGLPRVGSFLKPYDVVIGKVSTKVQVSKYVNHSTKLKSSEKGYVDQVCVSTGADGAQNCKVRIHESRTPGIGDKFSSMHGQKGVVGMIYTQEDLFFTQQGIVPDVVINPHAFPTRQTLAQLLESALGKASASQGCRKNATPFAHGCVEDITEQLAKSGFQRWGLERVYSGRTGKSMEALTTIGVTFYQRLLHMSEDKVKWRSTHGPVHPLTLQAVKDKNRRGGIKFGEMERDCLISHGASAAVQERLFLLSDKCQAHVCTACSRMVVYTKYKTPFCVYCNTKRDIVMVEMPHACKLLHMELSTMCVDLRFKVQV